MEILAAILVLVFFILIYIKTIQPRVQKKGSDKVPFKILDFKELKDTYHKI